MLPNPLLLLRRFRPCRNNHRTGAAVVEFAVVAPLLVLMVLGVLEYGRLLNVQQLVTNSAREGARLACRGTYSTSEVTGRVSDYLAGEGLDGETVTVTPNPPSSAAVGAPVTVEVQMVLDGYGWLTSPVYLSGRVVRATVTMRREAT